MMRERVIDEATSLGLRVYQNYYGQWVIKKFRTSTWLLQEHKSGKWVVIANKTPQAILNPKTVLGLLEELTKRANLYHI